MDANRDHIFSATLDYFLAPVAELMADESVREVMINGMTRSTLRKTVP